MNTAALRQWLWTQRSSARVSFLFQVVTRVVTSVLGLVWTRLLFAAMGLELNGLYLAFQKLTSLGGLGDLGMGGVVALRTGQLLGEGKENALREFLAAARGAFLVMALGIGGGFLLFSPWLRSGLGFQTVAGAGSMPLLFVAGGVTLVLLVFSSYASNLNYGCANVLWPILPAFLLTQGSLAGHWSLARLHAPLWVQYSPYIAASAVGITLSWFYVRRSHPALAQVRSLSFQPRLIAAVLEKSLWMYLITLGSVVFMAADSLLINKGWGSATVAIYNYNYRLCEVAWMLIGAASYVSIPKIVLWLSSPEAGARARVIEETHRLNRFQVLMACAAGLGYLAINDAFLHVWLPKLPPAPLEWQIAFAASLAVTIAGDAGIQLSFRCGERGLRFNGCVVGLTALIKLALAWFAMRGGSIAGIAASTVVSQSILSLVAGAYVCRHFGMSAVIWALRNWILPLTVVGLGALARHHWPLDSLANAACLAGVYGLLLFAALRLSGGSFGELWTEAGRLRALFRR
jgi:O-antigen/teichoic acid export membrane protein